jgi:hypothetical protein
VSNGTLSDVFWRSAMSGGRATVAFRKHGTRHRNQVGDISYVNDIGKKFIDQFVVECKFYADLNYLGLLTGKGKLLDFWAKLKKEAKDHDKHPFLVARQNRLQAHVIVDIDGRRELGFSNSRQTLLISIPHNLYIYDADNFFKACPPYL